jgi:hypothetical protein
MEDRQMTTDKGTLKQLAIQNHSQTTFVNSVSDDTANRQSRSYRIKGSPYGLTLYFNDFVFYAELFQQGIDCDKTLLNRLYPVAYIDPSEDNFGRQSVKILCQCPIVDTDTIKKTIESYIKTMRFRSICDSFKLTVSVAILEDGTIITGRSAYNVYTKFKTTYDNKRVLTCWIPYQDRPKELYKAKRDSRKSEIVPTKKYKINSR